MSDSAFRGFVIIGLVAVIGLSGITVSRLTVTPSQVRDGLDEIQKELDVREKRFEEIEYQLEANTMATRWRFTSVEFQLWVKELQEANSGMVIPAYTPYDRQESLPTLRKPKHLED